jgi:hypothetical protein
MAKRFELVNELSREIIDMYDAAEDYSEDQLYHALDLASESGERARYIAREVLEGAVAMVIDELMTTEMGLEILMRINSYRREQNTDKVTDTGRIHFEKLGGMICVVSQNFSEPQDGDWRGKVLAHVPYIQHRHSPSASLKRAQAIAEAIARFTIENPPD